MEYNVVEDLKKRKKISILNVCKIYYQSKLLLNGLKDNDVQPTTVTKNTTKTTTNILQNAIVNVSLL
jgi:hypothetical protein